MRPVPAVLARTAVACARVGSLTAYSRPAGAPPYVTTVSVAAGPDGSVVAYVGAGSLAAQLLVARPLATVQVAPPACQPVTLLGAARRLPGRDPQGRLCFRLDPGAVRVGRQQVGVAAADYRRAEPDPLGPQAAGLLSHLNAGHRDALAACLRALGHDAATAHATELDAGGLTSVALGDSGVTEVRLAFPERVQRLEDLASGPGSVLLCRCGAPTPRDDRRQLTSDPPPRWSSDDDQS